MTSKLFVLALILSMLFPVRAWAQPPVVETVGEAASPLKKGQPAPFTGVLLSPEAVAKVTVELKTLEEKLKIAVDRTLAESKAKRDARVADSQIKHEADVSILKARLDASLKENKLLNRRLEEEEKDNPNILMWTGGGVLAGIGVTILVVVVTK